MSALRTALVSALAAACGVGASAAGVGAPDAPHAWRCGHVEMLVGGAADSTAGLCAGPASVSSVAAPAARSERIAASTQADRDGERRAILERELQAEESRMTRLGRRIDNESPERESERVRIREDIDALHRELARLR